MLVFCNTKASTDHIAHTFKRAGMKAEAIHGDIAQTKRDYIMRGTSILSSSLRSKKEFESNPLFYLALCNIYDSLTINKSRKYPMWGEKRGI